MNRLQRALLATGILLLSISLPTAAQGNFQLSSALKEKFQRETEKRALYAPELIHLFTDRDVYAAGDTLWFSAWVLNDQTLDPTRRSRMLYVDLIDPLQKVVQDLVLEIIDGTAVGSFVFSENLREDAYFQLRAYTRWQLNFDSTYLFNRVIPVWQDPAVAAADTLNQERYVQVTKGASERLFWKRIREKQERKSNLAAIAETIPSDSLPIDLHFLPEGGTWLSGFPSRLAFKALAPDGYGIDIEGVILDQNDSLIAPFQSEHLGMGSLLLVPQPGKRYVAQLYNGQRVALPDPLPSGASLRADLVNGSKVSVTVSVSTELLSPKEPLFLTLSAPGYNPYSYAVPRVKTRTSLDIPLEELPGGPVRFTLYTDKAEPLAERLLFLPAQSRMVQFDVKTRHTPAAVPNDGSGDLLTISVASSDALTGKPVQTLLALSVTDSLFSVPDSSASTLRSAMLLESFVSGRVENPDYYFAHPYSEIASRLDLVMLTHGWRGFAEPKPVVITDKKGKTTTLTGEKALVNQPETEFSLAGGLVNAFGGSVARQFLTLLAQGDYSFTLDRITDQQGRFSFRDLPLQGTTKLTLIAQKENKERRTFNIGITIDSTEVMKKPAAFAPQIPAESIGMNAALAGFRRNKEADKRFLDSLVHIPGMHYIEEVSITSKRIVKNSYNKNGPGNADIVFDEQKLGKYDRFSNLLEVLHNEIPGFGKGYLSPDQYYFSKTPREGYDPCVVIGKQPVTFRVDGSDALYFAYDSLVHMDIEGVAAIPPTQFAKEQIYNQFMERLNQLPVAQIVGIEVMTSRNYVWTYMNEAFIGKSLDYIPPAIIEITTREGKGLGMKQPGGQISVQMRGFSTPKLFYVPGYIPTDYPDRLSYHRKATLFWSPSLASSDAGVAELSFPVGRNYPRTLRLSVTGYDLGGKVGNGNFFIRTGTGKGAW